jgi:ABC-type branched-subunit amino acid transport system substrate-binding protein
LPRTAGKDAGDSDPLDFFRAWEARAQALEKAGRALAAARLRLQAAARLQGARAAQFYLRAYRTLRKKRKRVEALRALAGYGENVTVPYGSVFAARKMSALADRLTVKQKSALFQKTKAGTLLRGLLAPAVAQRYLAQGKGKQAQQVLRTSAAARRAFGKLRGQGRVERGSVIGCLLSLSGPYRRLAVSVMRGVLLAADVFGPPGGSAFEVVFGDVATGGAAAVDGLRFGRRAVAAIGPVSPKRAVEAAAQAQKRGFPLLAITPAAKLAAAAKGIFRFLPQNTARARALAAAVMGELPKGARVGLITLDSKKGKQVAASLKKEVQRLGGRVVTVQTYAARATHFAQLTAALKKARVAGVVAFASARVLEMLAPQLALAGLWPKKTGSRTGAQRGGRRRPRRRASSRRIVLGATGDGMTAKRLGRMSRYLQSAFLCPGFFPSGADPRWGEFVRAYKRAYGRRPNLVSAYAYEATVRLRQVLEAHRSVGGRKLAARLAKLKTAAGKKLFDAKGNLVRRPLVYRVVGMTLRKHR